MANNAAGREVLRLKLSGAIRGKFSRIVKSAAGRTLLATAAILGFGFVSSIQLSRALGPAGRGEIAAAMLWPVLLSYIFSCGLGTSIIYFSASAAADADRVFSTAAPISLLQAVAGIGIGYCLIPFLLKSQSEAVISASRLYLAVIPVALLSQYAVGVLQARLKFTAFNWLRMIIPAGYVIGIAALHAGRELSVRNVILLHLGLNVATTVVCIVVVRAIGVRLFHRPEGKLAKRMIWYGLQVQAGDVSQAANLRLDQALLSAWFPPAQLGLYVVAVSASGLAEVLSTAVRTVSMPTIAAQPTMESRRARLSYVFRRYWMLSLLATVALAAAFPFVIPRIFGSAFANSVVVAEILLVGSFCLAAKNVLAGGAQALGSPWLTSRAEILAFGVTVATLFLLVPKWGILGAAVASVAAYATQLVVLTVGLSRKHGITPWSLIAGAKEPLRAAPANCS
jgi:O-antigen/teichoic acid export membrane protein